MKGKGQRDCNGDNSCDYDFMVETCKKEGAFLKFKGKDLLPHSKSTNEKLNFFRVVFQVKVYIRKLLYKTHSC